MRLLSLRGLFLFVCIGVLACEPYNVCGLKSKDLGVKWENGKLSLVRSFRILKDDAAMEDLHSKLDLAPAPSNSMTFHSYQSNKRTVRKGSDPIHNRSWTQPNQIYICNASLLLLMNEVGWVTTFFVCFFFLLFGE